MKTRAQPSSLLGAGSRRLPRVRIQEQLRRAGLWEKSNIPVIGPERASYEPSPMLSPWPGRRVQPLTPSPMTSTKNSSLWPT